MNDSILTAPIGLALGLLIFLIGVGLVYSVRACWKERNERRDKLLRSYYRTFMMRSYHK